METVVTFGLHKPAAVTAKNIERTARPGSILDVVVEARSVRGSLPLLGEHSIYNALAGIAVGLEYGVPLEAAVQSLASLIAGDKRGEVLRVGGATIINDCYNSNPKALG